MSTIIRTILSITLGVAGMALFFGDNESLLRLILSKPLGIILLMASYSFYKSLQGDYQYTINNNQKKK